MKLISINFAPSSSFVLIPLCEHFSSSLLRKDTPRGEFYGTYLRKGTRVEEGGRRGADKSHFRFDLSFSEVTEVQKPMQNLNHVKFKLRPALLEIESI
jgi:hypothetical protein